MSDERSRGLVRISQARRAENLRSLRAAAERILFERGYLGSSVEQIAHAAGVSRQTFYRHFDGKFAVALDLFEREWKTVAAFWRTLAGRDLTDLDQIEKWVDAFLDFYASRGQLSRAFIEVGLVEPAFAGRMQRVVPDLIEALALDVPVFARAVGAGQQHEQWGDACLLIQLFVDQYSAAALNVPIMERSLLVRLLARKMQAFIRTDADYDVYKV